MSDKRLEAALDLMRRMPPSMMNTNLEFLVELAEDIQEDLLQNIDCPLAVRKCETGKDYLICEYNRDGDSYRSPWSNKYDPPLEDGVFPSPRLRKMEEEFNHVFKAYTQQYYEGGISSCYFWDTDEGFACCVLIRKEAEKLRGAESGIWDSIHVIDVIEKDKTATYKLVTSIILSLKMSMNNTDLSGTISREVEKELKIENDRSHLVNIGDMIQEVENELRDKLMGVYFDKTREITSALRSTFKKSERDIKSSFIQDLKNAVVTQRR